MLSANSKRARKHSSLCETANKEVQWHSKVEAGERCVGFLCSHCYPAGRLGVDGRVTVGWGRMEWDRVGRGRMIVG